MIAAIAETRKGGHAVACHDPLPDERMENRMNLRVFAPLAAAAICMLTPSAWATHCGCAKIKCCAEPKCCTTTQYQKVETTCYRDVCETICEKQMRTVSKTICENQMQEKTCIVN